MERHIKQAWTLWAKSDSANSPDHYLPLLTHLLDVAACTYELLQRAPASTRALFAQDYHLDEAEMLAWVSALAGLHDLGKASPTFQNIWPARIHPLAEEERLKSNPCQKEPHGETTYIFLANMLVGQTIDQHLAGQWANAVACHHGMPIKRKRLTTDMKGNAEWCQARQWIFDQVIKGCGADRFLKDKLPKLEAETFTPAGYMRLAGLTSFADWIGSSFGVPSSIDELPLHDPVAYFSQAREKAAQQLNKIGWAHHVPLLSQELRPDELFSYIPNFEPRSLQTLLAEQLANLPAEPTLILIEAPMGEGKTEAALHAATVLQRRLGHRGIYLALPTMATGNAMYERFSLFLEKISQREKKTKLERPDLQLMHGGQLLNKAYQNAIEVTRNTKLTTDNPLITDDPAEEGAVRAESWFSARKRASLSEYGVGTIDQVLLGVLNVRHHFIRLWGMGNRVVVLDEIHAYDTYTGELITQLIRWLRALNSSVILMSATLPSAARQKLLEAWGTTEEETAPYPRFSIAAGDQYKTHHISGTRTQPDIHLHALDASVEAVAGQAMTLAKDGGCIVVIANTVNRAQAIYQVIKLSWDGNIRTLTQGGRADDLCLLLFHARFPAHARQQREEKVLERLGKQQADKNRRPKRMILVATQVAEQSLDFDADVMISDLAPVDLLLQRAGRLHRHRQHDGHRYSHTEPRLWVAGLETWPREALQTEAWQYIYEPFLLYRTWLALQEVEKVTWPSDLEMLVEYVYSDTKMGSISNDYQDELEKAQWAMRNRESKETIYAEQHYISQPERFFERPTRQKCHDDTLHITDEGAHDDSTDQPFTNPQTRLARKSIRIAPVFKDGPTWVLERTAEDGTPPPCLRKGKLSGAESAALFRRSLVLSRWEVVEYAAKKAKDVGLEWDAWQYDPLLYGCVPLPFENNEVVINQLRIRFDPELGLVYHNEQ